ncbi:hypothetical protein FD755_010038 [Muntiacus reevesi]|uniref:Uncharacterized protein n=1 Tax=Muntiacus reevesi TaxID=9886 RepID=A0A5N3XX02_MUNRE|nr:hypothetical protein FD755_010038 [Muntiacus reevesi]
MLYILLGVYITSVTCQNSLGDRLTDCAFHYLSFILKKITVLQPIKPTVLFSPWGPSVQWLQTAASLVVYATCCPKGHWRQLFLVGIHDWPAVSQSRLQTGMRGAFGKPQGTVARVHIGQVIMSVRTKLQNKEHVIEALRWAKFKFPGRQKTHISKKWEFTKFNADEFENMVAEKRLIPDGCGVKYIPNRGPLDKWRALYS